jgi:hypothetical protein
MPGPALLQDGRHAKSCPVAFDLHAVFVETATTVTVAEIIRVVILKRFFCHGLSMAYCTVLAVKDRVTGHNPLAAVYLLDSYYARLIPLRGTRDRRLMAETGKVAISSCKLRHRFASE